MASRTLAFWLGPDLASLYAHTPLLADVSLVGTTLLGENAFTISGLGSINLIWVAMSEKEKKTHDDVESKSRTNHHHHHGYKDEEHEIGIWGILIFGLIGATATTLAVGHMRQMIDWFSSKVTRTHSWKGDGRSFRSTFQEESWKRYNRRMQEAYEEEMERVERIRRMQSVFNREKSKQQKRYESWKEYNGSGYHQHFQRDDWYFKTETSQGYKSHFREPPRPPVNHTLSHHYAILGLSRSRTKPYTDDEIKTAFRSKAKQFHPDQNQENKEVAEARFKEVMTSYEAIKTERKNMK
ncbi:uncharacterized protein LOC143550373 [Bidens hawaiensis]|uniref:uncharacterized protein LOC143550373 n=1 Tax=Bidens hawaiensis TaxID=980011 RepID=UPI00404B67B5